MMTDEEIREMYESEPWGKLLIEMGLDPYETESVARRVAEYAAERPVTHEAVKQFMDAKRAEFRLCMLSYTAHYTKDEGGWWSAYDKECNSIDAPDLPKLEAKLPEFLDSRTANMRKIEEHKAEIAKLEAKLKEAGNE